jgi:hypothetical protein
MYQKYSIYFFINFLTEYLLHSISTLYVCQWDLVNQWMNSSRMVKALDYLSGPGKNVSAAFFQNFLCQRYFYIS